MTDTWYKDAIIYEAHVRGFYDSNGDGIGDFHGLTQKLPYLSDLGVTCVWLLPFYPSPLRDDGYDIAEYTSINPMYGTLDDFKRFLDAAHALNIRVLTGWSSTPHRISTPGSNGHAARRKAHPNANILLERHGHEVQRHPRHLVDTEKSN